MCRWQRNWCQFAWSTDNQFASSVQMHSKCRIKSIHGKKPLWENDWFLWRNTYTKQRQLTETKSHEISGKVKNSSLLKCITEIHVLLVKLYISVSRKNKQFFPSFPKQKRKTKTRSSSRPSSWTNSMRLKISWINAVHKHSHSPHQTNN